MLNLIEILNAAQGGDAVQNLSRQFGLSAAKTQAALEAMMPALSQGLQHNAQSQMGLGDILGHMQSDQHQAAFENPAAASGAQAVAAGQQVLGQLFGDGVAAQQKIALHAAQVSGVSSSILQQMLPVVASMVMGGLMKSLQNQGLGGLFGQLGQMAGQGGFGNVLGQMFGQGATPQSGAQPQASPGMGSVLGSVLGGMLGGAAPGAGGAGGLGDVLGNIFGGAAAGQAAPKPQAQPQPQPGAPPQGQPAGYPGGLDPALDQTGLETLSKMFNHGTQVAEAHQAGLQDILGQLLKPRR